MDFCWAFLALDLAGLREPRSKQEAREVQWLGAHGQVSHQDSGPLPELLLKECIILHTNGFVFLQKSRDLSWNSSTGAFCKLCN